MKKPPSLVYGLKRPFELPQVIIVDIGPDPKPIEKPNQTPPPGLSVEAFGFWEFIQRVELRMFPIPLEMRVFQDWLLGAYEVNLEVSGRVLERDSGRPTTILKFARVPYYIASGASDEARMTWLRDFLIEVVVHELDEALHLDSVRTFDPHAKG